MFFFYYCCLLPFIWLGKKFYWSVLKDTANKKEKAEQAVLKRARRKGKLEKYGVVDLAAEMRNLDQEPEESQLAMNYSDSKVSGTMPGPSSPADTKEKDNAKHLTKQQRKAQKAAVSKEDRVEDEDSEDAVGEAPLPQPKKKRDKHSTQHHKQKPTAAKDENEGDDGRSHEKRKRKKGKEHTPRGPQVCSDYDRQLLSGSSNNDAESTEQELNSASDATSITVEDTASNTTPHHDDPSNADYATTTSPCPSNTSDSDTSCDESTTEEIPAT